MTRPQRATVALSIAVGLLLAGCSDDDDGRLSPEIVDQSQQTSKSEDEVASDNARARVYNWVDGRTTMLASPEDYRSTATIGFAEGREASELVAEAGRLDMAGQRMTGKITLVGDPESTTIDLDPPAKQGVDVAPFVEVRACVDESRTQRVDSSGDAVAGSRGKGPRPMRFHVANRSWPNPDSWRITWHEEIKGSC